MNSMKSVAEPKAAKIMTKMNTGRIASEFPSREFGYSGTTIEHAISSAKKFGVFKPIPEKGSRASVASVKVSHDMGFAAFQAIAEAISAGTNGIVHTPAILCANRQANSIIFTGGITESKPHIELAQGFLLVLDNPEFIKVLSDAASMVRAGKNVFEALPGQIELTAALTVYKSNTLGAKVDRSTPFISLASYYGQAKDESY